MTALPKPGERLGGWLLERQLGAGGMGAVFMGVAATGARRAIKVPFFEPSDQGGRARFEREAQALAKLPPHRGVVRIHATGTDRGFAFVVLELVEGRPLDAWIEEGLAPERAVEIAIEVARALEHIHAAGVVHRDLKPANVLVRADGTPVIVDFGLARDASASALTKTGEVLGTPAYMPPEQIDDARTAGPLADVYSLGATLYHALAGRAPFEGSGPQLLKAVLMKNAAAPSTLAASPASAASSIATAHLDAVVLRALAKDPAHRYPTAKALREDLERVRAGEPIQGSAPGRLERIRWRMARSPALRRTLAAGAALLLVAASAGVVVAIRQRNARTADKLLATAIDDAKAARVGTRDDLRAAIASLEVAATGPVTDPTKAVVALEDARALLAIADAIDKGAFNDALRHAKDDDPARSRGRIRCRIADACLGKNDVEAALRWIKEVGDAAKSGAVVAAVASDAHTLRARASARRAKAAFAKDAEDLVAFLASEEGVTRIPIFLAALAPGLEEAAADVLVAVDARRPGALPRTLARELAPFFRARARAALHAFVESGERNDRLLDAAVHLTSLAWRANERDEASRDLYGTLDAAAVRRSQRGDLAGALKVKLQAIRCGATVGMSGADHQYPRFRADIEERIRNDPADWPARLVLGQHLLEAPPDEHERCIGLLRGVIADEHVPAEAQHRARLLLSQHLTALGRRLEGIPELEAALRGGDGHPDLVCLTIANIYTEEWLAKGSASDLAAAEKWARDGFARAQDRDRRTLAGTLDEGRDPTHPQLRAVQAGETHQARLRLLLVCCAIARGALAEAQVLTDGATDRDEWRAAAGRAFLLLARGEIEAANKLLVLPPDEVGRDGLPDALGRFVKVLHYAGKAREADAAAAARERLEAAKAAR